MKAFLVENRSVSPDSTGFVHLLPVGTFKTTAKVEGKAKEIDMVVDAQALSEIMFNFRADSALPNWTGYLVDKEHFSHDSEQSSEALGWIKTLERRDDGIWGQPEWTTIGQSLIDGKVYKHLSPALALLPLSANSGRAVALTDVGLTNKPRLKTLTPIQNRDGSGDTHVAEKETHKMDQICALLGLPAGSPEADIIAKIKTLQADQASAKADGATAACRATELEKELNTFKTAALNRDADAFVETHKSLITDAAKVKELFVKNRESAEAFIVLVKPPVAPAATQKVLNREDAKTPAGSDNTAKQNERNALIETICSERRTESRAEAYEIARQRKPELFA